MALQITQPFSALTGTTWDASTESNKRTKTISANTDITISNVPDNYEALLEVTNSGTYTLTINGTGVSIKSNGTTLIGILNVGGTLKFYPEGGSGSSIIIPDAPTSGVVDNTADTFNWTNNPLYTALADYEYTLDGGVTFSGLQAKPLVVGDTVKAIGQVGVRVKAATGRNPSAVLYNASAFTAYSEAFAWTNLTNAADSSNGTLTLTGATPAGGTATKALVKATGNFVQMTIPTTITDSAGVLLAICSNNTNAYNYTGSRAAIGILGAVFQYGGNLNAENAAGTSTNIGTAVAGQILKIEISGNDLLIKVDGVLKTTYSNALSSISTLYVKGIFTSTGTKLNLGRGSELL